MNITEEIIDSFLRGELNGAELDAFNKALGSDAALKQEVSMQSEMVDTIKHNRHQQLKSRLNSIEMKPVGFGIFSSGYTKLAASVGVVALLIGGYMLTTDSNDLTVTGSTTSNSNTKETTSIEEISPTTSIETPQNAAVSNGSINTAEVTENNTSSTRATNTTASINTVKIGAPEQNNKQQTSTSYQEPTADDTNIDYDTEGLGDNMDMPTINTGGATASASPQIKVNIVKEQDLGYRFYNNQLFLHGNFTSSAYELYELNNKPSKQLFLYFESSYYELIQGKTKLTKLTPITDEAVLAQLTQLRTHK